MGYRTDTLCGIFHSQALRYGDDFPFLTGKFDREGRPSERFSSMTWKEAREEAIDLAKGLIALGVVRGDRVVIFSESTPRWIIADQAIQACGAIGVPLYPTVSEEELAYMIEDSEARVVIASTQPKALEVISALRDREDLIIILMSPWEGEQKQGVYTFPEVIAMGKQKVSRETIEEGIQRVIPDDIASIIYTSGTTGRPKGVVLTQGNWVSNMHQCASSEMMQRERERDLHLKALVHIPLCHVYGRTSDYHVTGLHLGGELVFAESYQTVARDLLEVRPQVITSIPRLFEKTYEIVQSSLSRAKKPYQVLFHWAVDKGRFFAESLAAGKRMNPLHLLQFSLASMLVFSRLKRKLGMDRVVLALSGGGKLSKEICTFFRSLGIQLNEGYGLTETSPVINFNQPELFLKKPKSGLKRLLYDWIVDTTIDLMIVGPAQGKSPYANPISILKLTFCYYTLIYRLRVKPGTVGRPVIGTEEKIAPDGEILVKGPQVFKGYWKRPEETEDAFTLDGYFKTGDIGMFDEEGFLVITDRKKELFVTSGGKNIAPHPIEVSLIERLYIDQACLVGDGKKYLTALIVPDFESLKRYARDKGIAYSTPSELVAKPEIKALIAKEVGVVNANLPRYEQIKYFTLLDTPFDVSTGELTPSLKVKRRVINERYQELIERMYSNP